MESVSNSQPKTTLRPVYFLGVIGFAACVAMSLTVAFGFALDPALELVVLILLFVIWLVLERNNFFVPPDLVPMGVNGERRKRKRRRLPGFDFAWIMAGLPQWTRYIVWATWAYAVIVLVASGVHFVTAGSVHNGQYVTWSGASRPASIADVRADELWFTFFMTGGLIQAFVYPALYFFFEQPRQADVSAFEADDDVETNGSAAEECTCHEDDNFVPLAERVRLQRRF